MGYTQPAAGHCVSRDQRDRIHLIVAVGFFDECGMDCRL